MPAIIVFPADLPGNCPGNTPGIMPGISPGIVPADFPEILRNIRVQREVILPLRTLIRTNSWSAKIREILW
jgi:hypothetical protein